MYLTQVLNDIRKESAPPNTLHAEHLFKLNEAVFNLAEEEMVDAKMASKLFIAVQKIRTAYTSGKYDNTDSNFFYDYLALLGTMQNQHFFSQSQTEKMLSWIKEIVDDGSGGKGGDAASAAEINELKKKLATYEKTAKSLAQLGGDSAPAPKSKAKGKAKAQAAPPMPEPPAKKGKGKGKGKVVEEEPPKGKGKGKGKGKAVEPEPPSKGKKGKGKGKAPSESFAKSTGALVESTGVKKTFDDDDDDDDDDKPPAKKAKTAKKAPSDDDDDDE